MLNKYFSQCCLLLFPDSEGSVDSAFSALHNVSAGLDLEKRVYTHHPQTAEYWRNKGYQVSISETSNAGGEYLPAFRKAFEDMFRKVILLRSSPDGLETRHLEEAFLSLRILEFTLGPAKEGGIYLLGMNRFEPGFLEEEITGEPFSYKTLQRRAGALKAAMYKSPVL